MVIVNLACMDPSDVLISLHDTDFGTISSKSASITTLGDTRAELEQFSTENPEGPVVQIMGERLFGALTGNARVRKAFTLAFDSGRPSPIYLRMDDKEPAEYPWESLFDTENERFLALGDASPIARVVPGGSTPQRLYAALPLRMVAVLSAIKADSAGEWRSLRAAVETSGLDIRVHVIVGERDLLKTIEAEKLSWVTCELLSSHDTVRRALVDVDPQLVHLFCHGRNAGKPHLELATPRGHAANPKVSNVQIGAGDLPRNAAPSAWLVTLNCCASASDTAGVRGLAAALVSDGGFPAAIGMREPITDDDAHLICQQLYTEVLTRLRDAFAANTELEAEWAGPLSFARRALSRAYANGMGADVAATKHRNWTVPILCVDAGRRTIDPIAVHPTRTDVRKVLKEMQTIERAEVLQTSSIARHEIQVRLDELRARLGEPA